MQRAWHCGLDTLPLIPCAWQWGCSENAQVAPKTDNKWIGLHQTSEFKQIYEYMYIYIYISTTVYEIWQHVTNVWRMLLKFLKVSSCIWNQAIRTFRYCEFCEILNFDKFRRTLMKFDKFWRNWVTFIHVDNICLTLSIFFDYHPGATVRNSHRAFFTQRCILFDCTPGATVCSSPMGFFCPPKMHSWPIKTEIKLESKHKSCLIRSMHNPIKNIHILNFLFESRARTYVFRAFKLRGHLAEKTSLSLAP